MKLRLKEKILLAAVALIAIVVLLVIWLRPKDSESQMAAIPLAVQTQSSQDTTSQAASDSAADSQQGQASDHSIAQTNQPEQNNQQPQEYKSKYPEVAKEHGGPKRDPNDPLALGRPDAPVVLLEFSDYRCPYCGLFHKQTFNHIVEEYVNTGKLRIEWRDFAIFGKESENAAVAARAAGEQGKYWEYNHAVYQRATTGHQPLPKKTLLEIARQVGIPDMQKFEKDMESPRLRELVMEDRKNAAVMRLQATPSFVIGTQAFSGAHPLEQFRKIIDAQLQMAESTQQ